MQNAETEEQDAEVKVQNAGIQDAETVSPDKKLRVVYLSPQGKTFDQKMAEELAEEEDLVLLCGHYEGIDERVLEEIVTGLRLYRRLCAHRRGTSGLWSG